MLRAILLTFAICLFLTATPASAEDVQSVLNSTHKSRIYILRHPIAKDWQRYDGEGNLLTAAPEGPWTVYGGVEIANVELTPALLRVTGNRLLYGYQVSQKNLRPVKAKAWHKTIVTIECALSSPLTTSDEANALLNRIFTFNETELVAAVPEYWRSFLQKQISDPPLSASPIKPAKAKVKRSEANGKPHDWHGITPPEPLKAAAPSPLTGIAEKLQIGGIVVLSVSIDENGKVQQPEIFRPVGFGLDEQAIATVAKWTFKPATKDGKAVPINMMIEVAF
jgi:TonB family protein